MDLQAEKLNILQTIINTNDASLIHDVMSVLQSRKDDWFDELSPEQQNDVRIGLVQLDSGRTFSHEEAKKRFGLI